MGSGSVSAGFVGHHFSYCCWCSGYCPLTDFMTRPSFPEANISKIKASAKYFNMLLLQVSVSPHQSPQACRALLLLGIKARQLYDYCIATCHKKANLFPTGDINLLIKYGVCSGAMHHGALYRRGGRWSCNSGVWLSNIWRQNVLKAHLHHRATFTLSVWRVGEVTHPKTIHLRQTAVSLLAAFLLHGGTNSSVWKEKPHFNYACLQMRSSQCWLLCLHMHRQQTGSVHHVFKEPAVPASAFMSGQTDREMETSTRHGCLALHGMIQKRQKNRNQCF